MDKTETEKLIQAKCDIIAFTTLAKVYIWLNQQNVHTDVLKDFADRFVKPAEETSKISLDAAYSNTRSNTEQIEETAFINKKDVTYKIWGDAEKIPDNHIEDLKQHAENRIVDMLKENYSSGELFCEIYDDATDSEIPYRGWWEIMR